MAGKHLYPIRINSLTIQNYKGIDELNLEFPKPISEFDPDVIVIGSLNGVGKTSVLECCSLLTFLSKATEGTYPISHIMTTPGIMTLQDIVIYDYPIRSYRVNGEALTHAKSVLAKN